MVNNEGTKAQPRVKGYCFSPPGCLVTESMLELTKECIDSFFVGVDIVPRLSLNVCDVFLRN